MESIEYYQARIAECLLLAEKAADEETRTELLSLVKMYRGVVARLKNYDAGNGFSVTGP
jgi:hypothetical protein